MKISLFILCAFLYSGTLCAQGFNWQYSVREPVSGPNLFFGGTSSYSFFDHQGEFFLFENETVCCPYKGGSGNGFELGFQAEYWYSGEQAFNLALNYTKAGGKFTSLQEYPRVNNVIQVVEFAYNSDLRYLSFEAGAKRRLFDSHLFTELTLAFMFKISDNSTHLERVVSPAELPFSDGSTEREFPYREISGLRSFNLVPSLSLGYDANLGNNLYAGISAGVKFPLMSQTSANNWIRWQTGINVSLHWGVGKYELF